MRGRSSTIILCALLAGCSAEGTYPSQCGAPLAGWRKPSDGYPVLAISNHVKVTADGRILWNGTKISAEQLSKFSSVLPQMNPVPFTILQIDDGANCSTVRMVRQTINEKAKCSGDYGSTCGEGAEPWARIGDVLGPRGETYKYYPEQNSVEGKP